MKLITKYKIKSKNPNIIYFGKDEVNNISNKDIGELLKFFFKKNRIVNAINLLKSLDKSTLFSLKDIIVEYTLKIPIEDKEKFCSLLTCTVVIYDKDELKALLNEYYKDDNIERYNGREKSQLVNLAKERSNDKDPMISYFINLLSKYNASQEQLVSYLKLCLRKGILSKDHVSMALKSISSCDDINVIVDFVNCFYNMLSINDLNDIVDSVICKDDPKKMFDLSTILTKKYDLLIKIGYAICGTEDAEYIYHFANQYYDKLLSDEREYFKICMSQTRNIHWITYFAISVDSTILNYYDLKIGDFMENVDYSSLDENRKKNVNKILLEYNLK